MLTSITAFRLLRVHWPCDNRMPTFNRYTRQIRALFTMITQGVNCAWLLPNFHQPSSSVSFIFGSSSDEVSHCWTRCWPGCGQSPSTPTFGASPPSAAASAVAGRSGRSSAGWPSSSSHAFHSHHHHHHHLLLTSGRRRGGGTGGRCWPLGSSGPGAGAGAARRSQWTTSTASSRSSSSAPLGRLRAGGSPTPSRGTPGMDSVSTICWRGEEQIITVEEK